MHMHHAELLRVEALTAQSCAGSFQYFASCTILYVYSWATNDKYDIARTNAGTLFQPAVMHAITQ
jgi:hypothetical protein